MFKPKFSLLFVSSLTVLGCDPAENADLSPDSASAESAQDADAPCAYQDDSDGFHPVTDGFQPVTTGGGTQPDCGQGDYPPGQDTTGLPDVGLPVEDEPGLPDVGLPVEDEPGLPDVGLPVEDECIPQSCEDVLVGILSPSSKIGYHSVQEILSRADGLRQGTWRHTPENSNRDRFRLNPATERRAGSFSLQYAGGAIRQIRSIYRPGSGDCTKEEITCLDRIEVQVNANMSSTDNTLSERFRTTLNIADPRDPDFDAYERPYASLSLDFEPWDFQGSQRAVLINKTGSSVEDSGMRYFARFFEYREHEFGISSFLETKRGSSTTFVGQTLFLFQED